jgi:hypothetical protein
MSGNFGQMKQGANRVNVNNATFDYLVAGFRLRKGLGLSLGFKPYSTIAYNYNTVSNDTHRDETTGELVRNATYYQGTGGLNQLFLGVGWMPFKNFSIGANVGLLWGSYTHIMMQDFTVGGSSSSNFDGFNFIQNAEITTYKIDLGAQYAFRLTSQDWLSLGATVSLGHKFDGDAFLYRFMTTGDTLSVDGDKNGLDIPMTYAGGISWHHKNKLIVSADAHYQMWSACRVPTMTIGNSVSYPSKYGMYDDMYILKAGAEYTPNPMAPSGYHNHIKYRVGASYCSSYMNIPQMQNNSSVMHQGPSEFSLSAGVGLPILNRINNRSMVNLGVQWLRRSSASSALVSENYFILNIGVSFNERWFMKYKIH